MRLKVTNARLSFPSLFRRAVFNGVEGKFEATLLVPKTDPQVKRIREELARTVNESGVKVPRENSCVLDGDNFEYEGYEGMVAIRVKSTERPQVLDRKRNAVAEEDGLVYAGCYVNAIIDFWIQDNKYGKRANGNLYGVQFVRDGEPFGSRVDAAKEFDDIGDEQDDAWDDGGGSDDNDDAW